MPGPNEELLGGGGEEFGEHETHLEESQETGEVGGERPELKVVPKPDPDAWKQAIPENLRDSVKSPEEAQRIIERGLGLAKRELAKAQQEQQQRLRKTAEELTEQEYDSLIDEHDREMNRLVSELGAAIKTPEGQDLVRKAGLKTLVKGLDKRMQKTLEATLSEYQRGTVLRDQAKAQWFGSADNQDLAEYFPYIEEMCDHHGVDADDLAAMLRQVVPMVQRVNTRRNSEEEFDGLEDLDGVSSISPVARSVFKRTLRNTGMTLPNRPSSRLATKEEQGKYNKSHKALLADMFGGGPGKY